MAADLGAGRGPSSRPCRVRRAATGSPGRPQPPQLLLQLQVRAVDGSQLQGPPGGQRFTNAR
jgi:hypothetical protein